MHLVYSDAHPKYTDIVYTKRINEVYAVAHTVVLQPLLHSVHPPLSSSSRSSGNSIISPISIHSLLKLIVGDTFELIVKSVGEFGERGSGGSPMVKSDE